MPEQRESFSIYPGKYFLLKNDKGSVLIRTDDRRVADSFIEGYQYCVEKEVYKKRNSGVKVGD